MIPVVCVCRVFIVESQNAIHSTSHRHFACQPLLCSIVSSLFVRGRRLCRELSVVWLEFVLPYNHPMPPPPLQILHDCYLKATWLTSGHTVAPFPTGNGTNAAILTDNTSLALLGQFQDSYWVFNGLNTTYSLYMEPTADSAAFPRSPPYLPSSVGP